MHTNAAAVAFKDWLLLEMTAFEAGFGPHHSG
jgi:hypothetical protein